MKENFIKAKRVQCRSHPQKERKERLQSSAAEERGGAERELGYVCAHVCVCCESVCLSVRRPRPWKRMLAPGGQVKSVHESSTVLCKPDQQLRY